MISRILRIVTAVTACIIVAVLGIASLVYSPRYVIRVILWQDSDAFDWQKFPAHPVRAASQIHYFHSAPAPRVSEVFNQLSGAKDWDAFLAQNSTQAFIVIQDNQVLYENYFNNTARDSVVTSFSAAKSFTSALIGIAIDEGSIKSADDPITRYLPELEARDPRFKEITIRHLLLMASGLDYSEFKPLLFNSDDILTSYYPDQRRISLENTHIKDPPGKYFRYNKYHPQLLGMILERATGMSVTQYMQTRLWDRIGMEHNGSWSTDSEESDFERMEVGVNATAIDFAKFGVLFLRGGRFRDSQVISRKWVEDSTRPQLPEDYNRYYSKWFASLPGKAYYRYMWWGFTREGASADFAAMGNKGQFIYVSPRKNLVIVRNGIEYGIPPEKWLKLFYDFAGTY